MHSPPNRLVCHKKKERQAFHVPSSRSALPCITSTIPHATTTTPFFFSLVCSRHLPPRQANSPSARRCLALVLPSRVLSPSQLLLEPPRGTPPLLLMRNTAMSREKSQTRKTKAKQRRAALCPKFQYAVFAPAATSHERLVDKSRLKRTGMRGGPPPPGE